ncbi:BspA family leucine-rich repeat surface protein [Chryseobacterium sp. MMS23-Vi53]|uniref:BspA family leucine-rich repeat surface protein n=1 Tax=Chryseobacterium sp. MMS23-Vi53 TaxID=3386644 RepID=UPI0039E9FAAC
MLKKLLTLFLFIFLIQITKAQNEFITVWKPNLPATTANPIVNPIMPNMAGQGQIWFPGIGENYTIAWEEVGFPSHNDLMENVTSTDRVFIYFGTPLNPVAEDATYRVKVSNGNGNFKQIRFANNTIQTNPIIDFILVQTSGSSDKIVEIEQWGNIKWTSMNNAFAQCMNVQLTATDSPDLSIVEDASLMFNHAYNFKGAPSMENWDVSHVKNFKYMFGHISSPPIGFVLNDTFNPPIGTWNTSSAQDLSYMFTRRRVFNQNINNWNTSNVTNMAYLFAECTAFNQPLNNWDTSKVTNMMFMLHFLTSFNQPLDQWDTSNVINMGHLFHGCTAFDQPINMWNTSKVIDMNTMFSQASSFNQTLQDWRLDVLSSADNMFYASGVNCENFSKIIYGWALNPSTSNNVNLQSVSPLVYSAAVINERSLLLSKGWSMTGDTMSECSFLDTSEHVAHSSAMIFPNPADDVIFVKNISDLKNYIISDVSGRIIMKDSFVRDYINVQTLPPGNYILQIISKQKLQSFKFIKK